MSLNEIYIPTEVKRSESDRRFLESQYKFPKSSVSTSKTDQTNEKNTTNFDFTVLYESQFPSSTYGSLLALPQK